MKAEDPRVAEVAIRPQDHARVSGNLDHALVALRAGESSPFNPRDCWRTPGSAA